jgi:hypothetical protein
MILCRWKRETEIDGGMSQKQRRNDSMWALLRWSIIYLFKEPHEAPQGSGFDDKYHTDAQGVTVER